MKGKVFVIVLLLCKAITVHAEPTVWYVHPDSALNTIQAGLDSCADNDIVLVGPGTYYENIDWPNTQGIHLTSELGPEITVIDGDSAGRVIRITAAVDTATVIRGFTIRNGLASGAGYVYGGGIWCNYSSSVTIAHNIISNNHAVVESYYDYAHGGGISCGYAIIDNNTIQDNSAGGEGWGLGGGIWCWNALITNNIIENNTAGTGGGIASPDNELVIIDNIIENNSASQAGGGVCCFIDGGFMVRLGTTNDMLTITCHRDSSVIITSSIINGNTANYGGGIYLYDVEVAINNSTITNNITSSSGGAIYMNSYRVPPPVIMDSSTISNNVGGGVEAGDVTMNYCNITNNIGHGVSTCGSSSIHYCNIVGNSGYGVHGGDSTDWVNAENNWWGDSTGPYHFDSNPGGQGEEVSDYVDFIPWLTAPVGVKEKEAIQVERWESHSTIFSGPLRLPEGEKCRVFDITGRVVAPDKIRPGIYFIEIDGAVTQKVVKIK